MRSLEKSGIPEAVFPQILQYFRNALALAYLNPKFPEGGQTLMYEVHAEGKRVQVMGSLGLQEDQEYPQGADLLILPFQGSEFLEAVALEVVERLQPKRILLDHLTTHSRRYRSMSIRDGLKADG